MLFDFRYAHDITRQETLAPYRLAHRRASLRSRGDPLWVLRAVAADALGRGRSHRPADARDSILCGPGADTLPSGAGALYGLRTQARRERGSDKLPAGDR